MRLEEIETIEDEFRENGTYPNHIRISTETDSPIYPSAGRNLRSLSIQSLELPVNNIGQSRGARESTQKIISRSRVISNRTQRRLLDLRKSLGN